jgi:hypothetical protein
MTDEERDLMQHLVSGRNLNMTADGDAPFMTEDQAESILMAIEVGVFHGTNSEAAHARLLIAARDKRESDRDAAETLAKEQMYTDEVARVLQGLPVTGDGKHIVPDMKVWLNEDGFLRPISGIVTCVFSNKAATIKTDETAIIDRLGKECYSTRQAAMDANDFDPEHEERMRQANISPE